MCTVRSPAGQIYLCALGRRDNHKKNYSLKKITWLNRQYSCEVHVHPGGDLTWRDSSMRMGHPSSDLRYSYKRRDIWTWTDGSAAWIREHTEGVTEWKVVWCRGRNQSDVLVNQGCQGLGWAPEAKRQGNVLLSSLQRGSLGLDFEYHETINLGCFMPHDWNNIVTMTTTGHVTNTLDASGMPTPTHNQNCSPPLGSESIPAKNPQGSYLHIQGLHIPQLALA